MCHLFSGIPTAEYEAETRSVRLAGHSTSIRLETMFWRVLEELASSQRMSLPRFLTALYDEVLDLHGEARNFTSLLRCACLKHLEERAAPSPAAACAAVLPDSLPESLPDGAPPPQISPRPIWPAM